MGTWTSGQALSTCSWSWLLFDECFETTVDEKKPLIDYDRLDTLFERLLAVSGVATQRLRAKD